MIFIVVRRTADWQDEAAVRAQLPEGFGEIVDLWNATFDMPYHLFRHELKRIAELNWSRVAGAVRVPREEVPAGAIVVPTDDDDWFAPGLAGAIEAGAGRHLGCRWPSRFIEVPLTLRHRLGRLRRRLFPGTRPKWFCTTNNYALVHGAVPPELLDRHVFASRWFLEHPDAIRRIEEPLSVMNRTLASQTSLLPGGRKTSRAKLLRRYEKYKRLYAAPPEALPWCAPYVARMADLMGRLHRR
jgi:hypothetical protein